MYSVVASLQVKERYYLDKEGIEFDNLRNKTRLATFPKTTFKNNSQLFQQQNFLLKSSS